MTVTDVTQESGQLAERTDLALQNLRLGFDILPVWGTRPDGICRCSAGAACTQKPGKHPTTQHGFKDATGDPQKVRTFMGSGNNYGMVWPASSPRTVFLWDVDGDDWRDRLNALEADYGPLPATRTTTTPSGGRHLFYEWPAEAGEPPKSIFGFVTRWPHTGYVVGPGSAIGNTAYTTNGAYRIAVFPTDWAEGAIKEATSGHGPNKKPRGDEKVTAGARHDYLRDRARALLGQGLSEETLFAAVWALNEAYCEPPKSEDEVRRAIGEVEGKYDPDPVAAKPKRKAARDRLIEYVEGSKADLFNDPLGHYYAHARIAGHFEVIDLASPRAGYWLTDLFMDREAGKAPDRDAIRDALDVMNARARKGDTHPVYTRVGPLPNQDGLALDLGDSEWRAAVVRAGAWAIEPHPVMFRRGKKAAAIAVPVHEGSLLLLKTVLNITDERVYRLVVGFLLGALNPKGVYSGLMLTGGPGAAKTTGARLIRRVIDPTERMAEVAAMPKKQDAFGTTALGSWIPAFDNISSLGPDQSDWLAQLATGYSTSDRTLYSNADEFVISVTRPFIINGIDTADRGDLLSRVSTVELPSIDSFSTFDSLYESFDAEWPGILGGLLDVAASAVAEEPSLPTTGWRVRSADHVRWVTAGEKALGWEPRSYETMIWEENQRAQEAALDALPWTGPLRTFLDRNNGTWTGTMGDLLAELKAEATAVGERLDSFGWPKTAKGMGDATRRARLGLTVVGIRYAEAPRRASTGKRYEWEYRPPVDTPVVKVVNVCPHPVRGEMREGEGEESEDSPTYRDKGSQRTHPTAHDIAVELGLTDE
jgi:hypothetical protein